MARAITLHSAVLGLLSWVIPFLASLLLVGPDGVPVIPVPFFKSLMAVISGGVGAWLLTLAFSRAGPAFATGMGLGLFWLAINLALDAAVLLPLTAMPVSFYLQDIGLRYLLIPIMAVAIGVVAGRTRKPS